MTAIDQMETVTDYLAAGGLSLGFLIEDAPVRETAKAFAFPAVKCNSYGNPYNGLAWLPKSQLRELRNDHYTNEAPERMFFCPSWLYRANPTLGERV